MRETFSIFGIIWALMLLLTWYQPSALMSVARMVERASSRIVFLLRLRALAKQDSIDSYRRSYAWHKDRAA